LAVVPLIALRPGSAIRVVIDSELQDRRTTQAIRRNWSEVAGGSRNIGHDSSPIAAVEFVDYTCAFCKAFEDSLTGVGRAGEPALGVRFIIARRVDTLEARVAREAALAAICADKQSRFGPLHSLLLSDSSWLRGNSWQVIGRSAEIPDIESWVTCLHSEEASGILEEDSIWAVRLSVSGTPTFLSQRYGKYYGLLPRDALIKWLFK
jgi:protein-disulfide isomerase